MRTKGSKGVEGGYLDHDYLIGVLGEDPSEGIAAGQGGDERLVL